MMAKSGLLVEAELLRGELDAAALAFLARMDTAGVALVALARGETAGTTPAEPAGIGIRVDHLESVPPAEPWNAKRLLGAARAAEVDVLASWLVCRDPRAIAAAAQAGFAGVILIGIDPPPGDHGLVVNRADSLGDVPRVLIPRDGGCWHERKDG